MWLGSGWYRRPSIIGFLETQVLDILKQDLESKSLVIHAPKQSPCIIQDATP